jgi:hypothetical protein
VLRARRGAAGRLAGGEGKLSPVAGSSPGGTALSFLACPQCGCPAPRKAVLGQVYACPRCRNPVLAVAREDSPAGTASGADAVPGETTEANTPPRHLSPWRTALLAFAVLGAAYVGAYLLLTAEARRDRAEIVSIRGEGVLTAADPGPAPPGNDASAVGAWRRAKDLWDDRRRHEALTGRVRTMFAGMMAAFALQAALTSFVLLKSRRRASGSRGGAREP